MGWLQFKEAPSPAARLWSAVAGIGIAAGSVATAGSCAEAKNWEEQPIGNVAGNMEKVSADLGLLQRNPTDTDILDQSIRLIGNEGMLDDRLVEIEARSETLEPGQPLPASDLAQVEDIKKQIKKLGEEYRTASHNHAEKYVFIFGGLTIGSIAAWATVQFAEYFSQERKYN